MKKNRHPLKSLVVLFIGSFGILYLSFQILNQNYQKHMDTSISRLTYTNQVLKKLGNSIQNCQNCLISYSQDPKGSEENFSSYNESTSLIFQCTSSLQEEFTQNKNCLLYSRVIEQINEAQQSFVTERLYPYSGSLESFESLHPSHLCTDE